MLNWLRYWRERRDKDLQHIARIFSKQYHAGVPETGPAVVMHLSPKEFSYLTGYLEVVTNIKKGD